MEMSPPDTAYSIDFDEEGPDGHAFGRPPGLQPEQWPRSRVNGVPMAHLFTVRVPEQYRCAGVELAGLSVFQADDHVSKAVAGADHVIAGGDVPPHGPETAAFWSALADYARTLHSQERYREDDIGGGWAWIWLTEEELTRSPSPLPDPATKPPGYDGPEGAWEADRPARGLRVVARVDDPNVGKRYEEFDTESGYVEMYSEEGERLGLAERFGWQSHFGGTIVPPNGGEGFGPFFLSFDEEFGGANLGGDSMGHIDLATEEIGW
jgi:hypothetical protein